MIHESLSPSFWLFLVWTRWNYDSLLLCVFTLVCVVVWCVSFTWPMGEFFKFFLSTLEAIKVDILNAGLIVSNTALGISITIHIEWRNMQVLFILFFLAKKLCLVRKFLNFSITWYSKALAKNKNKNYPLKNRKEVAGLKQINSVDVLKK